MVVHQGSMLSNFPFSVVMDVATELARGVCYVRCCMLMI